MPPKRKRQPDENDVDGGVVSTASKRPKKATTKAWKMPPPLPDGEVLTDFSRNEWRIGGSVGKGGFGEIYLASPVGRNSAEKSVQYAIKVEPHENGPLFTELSFYRRVAKPDSIDGWVKGRKILYLPIPKYIGSGAHESQGFKYRFMVMERFGDDIEKLFNAAGRKFEIKTVCYLAIRLLEALEYLHSMEYVHADIKGSNLLVGYTPANRHKVFLVDYGLAYRFNADGVHQEYKPDPRRCHDGTIEFTSIDAHKGANPSRRGDLEILGYCLIQWAGGNLPWMGFLENKPKVAAEKEKYKCNPQKLLMDCFNSQPLPNCLKKYMETVYEYEYQEKPDYCFLRNLFMKQLKDHGLTDNKDGLDWLAPKHTLKGRKGKRDDGKEEEPPVTPVKEKKQSAMDSEGSFNVRRSPRLASAASLISEEAVPTQPSPKKGQQKRAKAPAKKSSNPFKNKQAADPKPLEQNRTAKEKSPSKKRKRRNQNSIASDDDQNNSIDNIVSPSKKVPEVIYPPELGYKKKTVTKAETFGSLAEKKRRERKK